MQTSLLLILSLITFRAFSQINSYADSINRYRREYINNHEVVRDSADRNHFKFYAPDIGYRITALFTRVQDSSGMEMATYSHKKKEFLVYGYADFNLQGKPCRLYLYQYRKLMHDPAHKDDLFLPFTDKTCGKRSYVCRYLNLKIADINNGRIAVDFNKCYNPYCAYKDGFNCPIPPRNNQLPIAIKAGEKAFPHKHRLIADSGH